METVEFDLFSLNVRGTTSYDCFVVTLDIIYTKQFSPNIVVHMHETRLNNLSEDFIDDLFLRRLPFIEIPAEDSAVDCSRFSLITFLLKEKSQKTESSASYFSQTNFQ